MGKLRTNAGDKDTSDAKDVALATIHNFKYCIPLDHPILNDHGVFYQCVSTEYLAHQAVGEYQVGRVRFLYENIILHKTFNISEGGDSVIN